MSNTKTILSDENILFSLEEMGIPLTEWDSLQAKIREKLFLNNSFFFPGNTPSLKNSKEILQIYTSTSQCCHAPVMRFKQGKILRSICSACKKPVNLKRAILGPSKPVREYRDTHQGVFLQNKPRFIEEAKKHTLPLLLGFYYIRDSERKFDYSNAAHILLDMMRDAGYFADDDCDTVMDYPLGYHVDKKRAGAYVVIMNNSFFRTLIDYL
jgi:hypothetical protein